LDKLNKRLRVAPSRKEFKNYAETNLHRSDGSRHADSARAQKIAPQRIK
jgi:hypothetical protein